MEVGTVVTRTANLGSHEVLLDGKDVMQGDPRNAYLYHSALEVGLQHAARKVSKDVELWRATAQEIDRQARVNLAGADEEIKRLRRIVFSGAVAPPERPIMEARIPITATLATAVKTARKAKRMSQTDLGVKAGANRNLITGIEGQKVRTVSSDALTKLQRILGVELMTPDEMMIESLGHEAPRPKRTTDKVTPAHDNLRALAGRMTIEQLADAAGTTVADVVELVHERAGGFYN